MKTTTFILLFLFLMIPAVFAQEADDKKLLENLLTEFLQGASENDADIHNRFWAEDLIYTSSNGEQVTKQDILDSLWDGEDAVNSEIPDYHAEETQIRLFDDMAVIAFKLVVVSDSAGQAEQMEFYNTGTFQKRDGQWKAVAWQATQIPKG